MLVLVVIVAELGLPRKTARFLTPLSAITLPAALLHRLSVMAPRRGALGGVVAVAGHLVVGAERLAVEGDVAVIDGEKRGPVIVTVAVGRDGGGFCGGGRGGA